LNRQQDSAPKPCAFVVRTDNGTHGVYAPEVQEALAEALSYDRDRVQVEDLYLLRQQWESELLSDEAVAKAGEAAYNNGWSPGQRSWAKLDEVERLPYLHEARLGFEAALKATRGGEDG
jgi:hypothetical protein